MKPNPTRGLALAIGALALALAGPVAAQEGEKAPITDQDVSLAAQGLAQQLQRIPAQLRAAVLVDYLIDRELLAAEARRGGVEDSETFKAKLAFYATQALRDTSVEKVLAEGLEDEAIQARYEKEIAKLPKEEEVHARHILVETEEEAKSAAEEVRGGADFGEVAKARSTGPSAANGGDLGYFTKDKMVAEFSKAAFALEVGEVSDPVKSKFGWHVIKLEGRRDKAPPALAEVEDSIRSLVLQDTVESLSGSLREAATIEFKVPGLDLSAMRGGGQGADGEDDAGEN
jgi:peptidyl-prolyl cis-trans isomerase C